MAKTVVCTFDSRDTAEGARRQLLANGFISQQIEVLGRHSGAKLSALGKVVERIFSAIVPESDEAQRYAETVRDGRSVLVLRALSDDTAARAETILRTIGSEDARVTESLDAAVAPAPTKPRPRLHALSHSLPRREAPRGVDKQTGARSKLKGLLSNADISNTDDEPKH